MPSQFSFILLPLILSTTISGVLAAIAWRRSTTITTRIFAWLMTGITVWSLAYTLEVASATYPTKIFWARMQYLGIVSVPPLFFLFSLAYSDRKKWLKRDTYLLLGIEPLLMHFLVWTNNFHQLIWIQTTFSDWQLPLDYVYGAFFWVHAAYTYSLLLLGTFILIQAVILSSDVQRNQAVVLLIGLMAPWIGNLIYLMDLTPFPYLDLTPFAFTITGLAVAWGLLRHRLLDIIPIARGAVIESMRDVVVVLDVQDRIIDLNPIAMEQARIEDSSYIGKTLEEVFPHWSTLIEQFYRMEELHDRIKLDDGQNQRIFDVKITPLKDRSGQLSGRVVIVSDITEWIRDKEALALSEKRYHSLFTTMNEGMALHEIIYNKAGKAIDYTILDVNPAYEKIIGISRAEAMGCRASVLYGVEDPPYLEIYTKVVNTGKPITFETTFEPIKKTFRISVFSPRKDEFASIFTDITDRKRTEEKLANQANIVEVTARLTAAFNIANSVEEVLKSLWKGVENLGFKYLSPYKLQGDRLVWDFSVMDLPGWLMEDIPEVISRIIGDKDLYFWVPLNTDNIYANCYHQKRIITTENDLEILEPIHLGDRSFHEFPAWVKRAALQMMRHLDVRAHRAIPFGSYGMLFLSNPSHIAMDEQIEWVEIILKQAEVAIARARATDKLLESENRYRALFERTNDAVLILGLDLIHLSVNQQAADMLGYKVSELIGMHVKELIAPEEWSHFEGIEAQLRNGQIPPIYRHTFIKKDGSRIQTEISVAMAYDPHGEPSHFQSIVRDVTEKVLIQEKLNLQATALEATANGILIMDRKGDILWANPAASKLTGYSLDEMVGNHLKIFDAGEHDFDFFQKLMEHIKSGQVWHGQLKNKRKDGSVYIEEMTITPVHDANEQINRYIAVKQDVTEQARSRELLEHLATHDPITNLPNRTLLSDRLNHAITQANRKQYKIGVLFFDLDNFKTVNDDFGHKAGDLLLMAVGQRLITCVRESDTVARLGGDEFTILLENINNQNDIEKVVKKLLESFSHPFVIQNAEFTVTFSIGISLYPDDGHTMDELLRKSDQAMYSVKQTGKNGYRFFSNQSPIE